MSTQVVNVRQFVVEGRIELPDDVVYVGRRVNRYHLAASPFANPYVIGGPFKGYQSIRMTRDDVLWLFADWLLSRLREDPFFIEPLRGNRLACWCPPKDCHADVLADWLNRHPPLPRAAEPIIFGVHAQPRENAETAPAWPSLDTVRQRSDARFRRQLKKVEQR